MEKLNEKTFKEIWGAEVVSINDFCEKPRVRT